MTQTLSQTPSLQQPHSPSVSSRFRGGGPGRPGSRAYFEDYAGQDEGFDHEDRGRGWDNGGRLGPHRGGGPPRGETSLLTPPTQLDLDTFDCLTQT